MTRKNKMIDLEIVDSLKRRFVDVHPLVFHRSVEHAESPGELFDILDTLPACPFIWDETNHQWRHEKDLTQSRRVAIIQKQVEK